jgi:hypothetical protein
MKQTFTSPFFPCHDYAVRNSSSSILRPGSDRSRVKYPPLLMDAGIPGVNVQLKGTATGTVTDAEGNYAVDAKGGGAVLVFSSIGYD